MLFCQACLVTLRTKLSSAVYCYQSCLCVCVCLQRAGGVCLCVCVCGSVTTITQKTDVKNAQAYQLDGDFCRGLLHVICPWVFRYFATPTGFTQLCTQPYGVHILHGRVKPRIPVVPRQPHPRSSL